MSGDNISLQLARGRLPRAGPTQQSHSSTMGPATSLQRAEFSPMAARNMRIGQQPTQKSAALFVGLLKHGGWGGQLVSRSCRAQLLPTDAERLGRSHQPFRHSPASSGGHTGCGSRCFLPGLGGRWSQKLLPGGWWPVALEPDRKGSTCADLGLSSPTCWGRSFNPG